MTFESQSVGQESGSHGHPFVRVMFDDLPDLELPQIILNNQVFEPSNVGYNLLEKLADNIGRDVSRDQLWDIAYPIDSTLNPSELFDDLGQLNYDLQQASRQSVVFIQGDARSERFRLAHCMPSWASETYLPSIRSATRVEVTQNEEGIFMLNGKDSYIGPAPLRLLAALPQPAEAHLRVGILRQQVLGPAGLRSGFDVVKRELDSVLRAATGEYDLVRVRGLSTTPNDNDQISTRIRTVWPQPDLLRGITTTYFGAI